jgi:hypothetical protein
MSVDNDKVGRPPEGLSARDHRTRAPMASFRAFAKYVRDERKSPSRMRSAIIAAGAARAPGRSRRDQTGHVADLVVFDSPRCATSNPADPNKFSVGMQHVTSTARVIEDGKNTGKLLGGVPRGAGTQPTERLPLPGAGRAPLNAQGGGWLVPARLHPSSVAPSGRRDLSAGNTHR